MNKLPDTNSPEKKADSSKSQDSTTFPKVEPAQTPGVSSPTPPEKEKTAGSAQK